MDRSCTVAHHLPQKIDEQLGGHPTLIGAEPEPTLRIHRRGRTNRLPLTGTGHDRRVPSDTPGAAMHGVGAKTRLIPEEHLPALCSGLSRDRGIGLVSPPLNCLGISLIRPLQWLLRRQIEL